MPRNKLEKIYSVHIEIEQYSNEKYEFDKALANATKWAKAKNQELPENSGELIEQIWKEEASLRN